MEHRLHTMLVLQYTHQEVEFEDGDRIPAVIWRNSRESMLRTNYQSWRVEKKITQKGAERGVN